jgi:hypothetical protein
VSEFFLPSGSFLVGRRRSAKEAIWNREILEILGKGQVKTPSFAEAKGKKSSKAWRVDSGADVPWIETEKRVGESEGGVFGGLEALGR